MSLLGYFAAEYRRLYEYCPNGPGGGIDPTCSPSGRDGIPSQLFHAERTIGDIKGGRSLGVFLTGDKEAASRFAGATGSMREVKATISKPMTIKPFSDGEFAGYATTEQMNHTLKQAGVNYKFKGNDDQEVWRFVDDGGLKLVGALKAAGYDALSFPDIQGNKNFTSILVFDRLKVK